MTENEVELERVLAESDRVWQDVQRHRERHQWPAYWASRNLWIAYLRLEGDLRVKIEEERQEQLALLAPDVGRRHSIDPQAA